MGATFTPSEVSKHSTAEDLYLIVHGKVYNVTKFQHEHPYVWLWFLLSSLNLI